MTKLNCHSGYLTISREMIEDGGNLLRKLKTTDLDIDWDIKRQRYVVGLAYCLPCACYYAETEEQVLIAVRILSVLLGRTVYWDCDAKKIAY